MSIPKKISGGVYLVIDPAMDLPYLLSRLDAALKGGLAAVQIWDNWPGVADKNPCITAISDLCRSYDVPLLIGNDWAALLTFPELDGVHFDAVPENYQEIRDRIGRPFFTGITCSGDPEVVEWAEANDFDYISFCAMFPSSSSVSCSIVMPETVRQARELTRVPLFVSGGITPQNIPLCGNALRLTGWPLSPAS